MNDLLARCNAFLRERQYDAYLVGGTVRDQELERDSHDIDLAAPRGALQMARVLANHFGGAYYPLDAERETGRVVMPDHFVIDVSLLRGADIDADLAARDFTINAMARRLAEPEILIDPHHGLQDLRNGVLRAVSDEVFVQDPARLLRAVRFEFELDLSIEPHTRNIAERDAALVKRVAGERVRDELLRMLQGPTAAAALFILAERGLLTSIMPRATADGAHLGTVEGLSVFAYDLNVLKCPTNTKGELVAEFAALLEDDLRSELESGHTNSIVVKLAALYDRPEDITADLGALRFRRDEIQYARALVAGLARLREVSVPITPLAAHRFFRDSGVGAGRMGLILLALADIPPSADPGSALSIIRALLTYYRDSHEQVIAPRPLLNGAELAQRFGLRSRHIGDTLKLLVEAQVTGNVRNVTEAEQLLVAIMEGH
jgi:poly(A) polymerase